MRMQYITLKNAAEFAGETVDRHKRMGHHYPLRVVRGVSGLYIVDRNDVMMPIGEHDSIAYDFIIEED